jgi:hypothetical protein
MRTERSEVKNLLGLEIRDSSPSASLRAKGFFAHGELRMTAIEFSNKYNNRIGGLMPTDFANSGKGLSV